MIFIRPVVLRSPAEARAATQPEFDRMLRMQQETDSQGRSSLDEAIPEPFGPLPEAPPAVAGPDPAFLPPAPASPSATFEPVAAAPGSG